MSRSYLNSSRITELSASVTERELAIVQTLGRVRLATGAQLGRLHFTEASLRHRRRVLESLTDRRLLLRLDRLIGGRRAGSSGFLYALDVGGQRLVSRVSDAPFRRPSTPGAPFIRHTLEITELYVRLIEAERLGRLAVVAFEAEPQAWRRYSAAGGGTVVVKPDAYVQIAHGAYIDSWFIEVDRGTEAPSTLTRKADIYRSYYATGFEDRRQGVFPKVLWLVPHKRRYQVVADVCGRQPAGVWKLHQVALATEAIEVLAGGAL